MDIRSFFQRNNSGSHACPLEQQQQLRDFGKDLQQQPVHHECPNSPSVQHRDPEQDHDVHPVQPTHAHCERLLQLAPASHAQPLRERQRPLHQEASHGVRLCDRLHLRPPARVHPAVQRQGRGDVLGAVRLQLLLQLVRGGSVRHGQSLRPAPVRRDVQQVGAKVCQGQSQGAEPDLQGGLHHCQGHHVRHLPAHPQGRHLQQLRPAAAPAVCTINPT